VFDVKAVVGRVVLLLVPEPILPRKDPPENQRNYTADGDTPSDDTPWDVVPRCIFRLPHERPCRISDAVGDQKDGIRRDSFRMTRGDGGDPGKDQDKASHTDPECPGCTQKPNLIFPWQKGDEEAPQKLGNNTKGGDVSAGVRDVSYKLGNCWFEGVMTNVCART